MLSRTITPHSNASDRQLEELRHGEVAHCRALFILGKAGILCDNEVPGYDTFLKCTFPICAVTYVGNVNALCICESTVQ